MKENFKSTGKFFNFISYRYICNVNHVIVLSDNNNDWNKKLNQEDAHAPVDLTPSKSLDFFENQGKSAVISSSVRAAGGFVMQETTRLYMCAMSE